MAAGFVVKGTSTVAPFTLKIHRGEGMALLAMSWRRGRPPEDLAGFAIEYREPGGTRFFPLRNRLTYPGMKRTRENLSSRLSPFQKFRWVHFPRNAELEGEFLYRVTPVFRSAAGDYAYGEPQEAALELRRETIPGKLNVTFTRGYVSSQAFVERYQSRGPLSTLLPAKAAKGLTFVPTHPARDEARAWMGFEARSVLLELLDAAIADAQAQVRVVAYDLNEPDLVGRLAALGGRLRIIIDDSGEHGEAGSSEDAAEARLRGAGAQVKRQHMGKLQHNKTLVVDGPRVKAAVCGSTNLSWRGLYVQANNAVVLRGATPVAVFTAAFESYWRSGGAADHARGPAAAWADLGLAGVDAKVTFPPLSRERSAIADIAADVAEGTTSSLFYSLAFLHQTPGPLREALKKVTRDPGIFVYGMSDRRVGGFVLQKPDGNLAPVRPAALGAHPPEPFKSEPTGGGGARLHHKFLVLDFDRPTARVYLGSYNFSAAADGKNGENLLLVRDRRVATAYMVEAVRLFDAYHFRVAEEESRREERRTFELRPHPDASGKDPWWLESYQPGPKQRDRELFA